MSIKKIDPATIRVSKNNTSWHVTCTDAKTGARYHYWSDDGVDLTPRGDVAGAILYKNPPQGINNRYDAGYFRTRYLKIEKNKEMVEAMRLLGIPLLERAKQEEIDREVEREEKQAAEYRDSMLARIRQYANHLKMPLEQIDDKELASALSHMIGDLSIGRKLTA